MVRYCLELLLWNHEEEITSFSKVFPRRIRAGLIQPSVGPYTMYWSEWTSWIFMRSFHKSTIASIISTFLELGLIPINRFPKGSTVSAYSMVNGAEVTTPTWRMQKLQSISKLVSSEFVTRVVDGSYVHSVIVFFHLKNKRQENSTYLQ